jgi:hypothetical protein
MADGVSRDGGESTVTTISGRAARGRGAGITLIVMRLDRLRQMTRDELRWRLLTHLRSTAQRAAASVRQPRWQRADVLRVLAPDTRQLVRADAEAARWQAVHEALADRLLSRPARFVLDPAGRPCVHDAVLGCTPDAADEARERASRVIGGEYDILGYRRLRFGRGEHRIDWHFDPVHEREAPRAFYTAVPYLDPAVGDHKIIWEINRHQHWLALGRAAWLTGDVRYARAIVDELDDWLEANPPLIGINWASMLEIGFRAISWTWALHCLLGIGDWRLGTGGSGPETREPALPGSSDPRSPIPDPQPCPWLVDLLVALSRQLTHVEQNLSYYFSPNTHLTGEALALYVVGTALPELAGAARWAATGRRILLDEIERQILGDGGHAERSTHYQRYTLDFYLLALLTARRAGDHETAARFAGAAGRLAEFTRVMADDEGRLPVIGDDDGGLLWPLTGRQPDDVRDSLSVAAIALDRPALAPWGVTEEAVWIAGPAAVANVLACADDQERPIASRALVETGYFVARDSEGGHAVFDAGAHGYLNAGHAHADALAVTLTIGHQPLLIDPGTSTYTMDSQLRDRFRSTSSHNTITVDGRSQSLPAGPFHWRTRADAVLEAWRHNESFDWAEARHDGYAPLQHRRALVRMARGGWLIADEILGSGRHSAAAHWHFNREWTVEAEGGSVRASLADGDTAWLLHDAAHTALFHGDEAGGLGWCAPAYGELRPSFTARTTIEGTAPLRLLTWIGEAREWPSPSLRRVSTSADDAASAVAGEITDGPRRALFMLRMGGAPAHAARTCRVLDFETDARLLHCLADGDRLVQLALVDVGRVMTARQGWLSIEVDGILGDLHVGISAGVIDLHTSSRPATLRLRGLSPAHRLRLNGRELNQQTMETPASLLILPTDWHNPPPSPTRLWTDSGAAFAGH